MHSVNLALLPTRLKRQISSAHGRLGLSVLCLLLMFADTQGAPVSAIGIGARDCSAFDTALAQESEAALDAYVAWAQGFVSGFNWANVRQLNVTLDAPSMLNAMADFCHRHPESKMFSAMQDLIGRNAR